MRLICFASVLYVLRRVKAAYNMLSFYLQYLDDVKSIKHLLWAQGFKTLHLNPNPRVKRIKDTTHLSNQDHNKQLCRACVRCRRWDAGYLKKTGNW